MSLKDRYLISFDCEGAWGVLDYDDHFYFGFERDQILDAYMFIVETLEHYELSGVFCFVAAALDSVDNRLKIPNGGHQYFDKLNSLIKGRCDSLDLSAALELVKGAGFPIGVHGGTHLPWTFLNPSEALEDIQYALKIFDLIGLDKRYYVYPRNQIAHEKILTDYGFDFRPEPTETLFPSYQLKEVGGGRFIGWCRGRRRFLGGRLQLLLNKFYIDRCIDHGVAPSLWTHPENIIECEQSRELFRSTLKYLRYKLDSHK